MQGSARIRLAAELHLDTLPPVIAARITETVETGLDPVTGSVLARRRRRFGALVLDDRTEIADPATSAAALAAAVSLDALPWTDAARQFQARVALIGGLEPNWPDLSDPTLAATLETWLAPHLHGTTRLAALDKLDLASILRSLLPWDQTRRLDALLPVQAVT